MWKAAEPADDFQMLLGVFDVRGGRWMLLGELTGKVHRFFLVLEVLTVLKTEGR